jgi:predicted house-cleaning noncanonical NTP pyrophosphatase (MazG superfamily)
MTARGSVTARWEPDSMNHAKLVRDKIPQIIRATGVEPLIRVADAAEYRVLLRAKLVEEVDEFLASDDPTELADVLEVVLTLADDLGVDQEHLEHMRTAKALERGGFVDRIVWSGNTPLKHCTAYATLVNNA